MKNLFKSLALGALTLTLSSFTANAQPGMGGPGSGMGFNTMFTKFFGDVKGFSAAAEMTVIGEGDTVNMNMEFALLDDKVRMDIDMSQMKSKKMPPGMGAQLKQMGMDKMAVIMDPKKKNLLMMYPGLKGYTEMPMPEDQVKLTEKEPKMEISDEGKETVESHPCKKQKVVVTDDAGKKQEVFVWRASDLKDFPVKMRTSDKGMDMTMIYKTIKLEKPEAKQFEPPADFTKYGSMQEMMMKAFGGGPPR